MDAWEITGIEIAALLLLVTIRMFPDFLRYMKMRSM
jgi:hypothetical protein